MATEGDKTVKPEAEGKKPVAGGNTPAAEVKPASEARKPPANAGKPKADIKPAPAREPVSLTDEHVAPGSEPSLGKMIASARERRGLSQSDAARDAHIPPHYLQMLESDDYSSISDQLYLLPFLRRYATFIGLDPEEVASRFVRDVQHADMNATRMSEPIQMIEPRRNAATVQIVVIVAIVAAVVALGWFGYRKFHRPRRIAAAVEPVRLPTAVI